MDPTNGRHQAEMIAEANRGREAPPRRPSGFTGNPELAREAGRKGGESLSRGKGPEHYRRIGKLGGEALKAKYGPEYLADIGRKGGKTRGERAAANKAADQ